MKQYSPPFSLYPLSLSLSMRTHACVFSNFQKRFFSIVQESCKVELGLLFGKPDKILG